GENSVEGWTVRASQPDPAEGPQGLLLPASGIEPGPMQSAPLEAVFPVAEDGTFELTLPPGASDPVELVDPQGFVRDRRSPPSGEREFVLEIGTIPRIRALLAAEPEGWLVVDDGDGRPQVLTSAGTDLDLPVAAGEGNLSLWRAGAPPLRLADWSIQEGALHDLGLLEVPSLGSLELIVREPGGARPLNFSVLIDGDDQLRAANSLRPRRGISFDGAGARVAKLPPGTWSVTVKSPGHVRAQASVVLGSGDHRRVELDLVPGVLVGLELDLPGFTRFGGEIVIEVLDAAENVVATERLDLPARPTLVPWSILLPEGEYEIRALTSSRGAGSLRVSARPALSGRSQGVLSME
ncbi:MAG: hypothetical protein O2816_15160, partial [Planctomycetota bacterium]|nr:hypothetical protein [Planctomycetota bacterium]